MRIKIEGELPLDGTTTKLYISEPQCTATQEAGSWRIEGTSHITLEPTIINPGDKADTALKNIKIEFTLTKSVFDPARISSQVQESIRKFLKDAAQADNSLSDFHLGNEARI